MQVRHGLTAILPIVDYDPESFFLDAELRCDLIQFGLDIDEDIR